MNSFYNGAEPMKKNADRLGMWKRRKKQETGIWKEGMRKIRNNQLKREEFHQEMEELLLKYLSDYKLFIMEHHSKQKFPYIQ